MTHEKNSTRIEMIVKRRLALRKIQTCLNKKHNAGPNPQGNQMHRGFLELGKYLTPGQEKIKGSRREFHQKGNTIKCRYATLDTLSLIHSITTAISLPAKWTFFHIKILKVNVHRPAFRYSVCR